MTLLFRLVLIPALIALVKSDFPLDIEEPVYFSSVDEEIYRLPEDLDPIHIALEITPYFEQTSTKEAFTFDGFVTLTVRAVRTDISTLTIHENVREIISVTVTDEAGVQLAQSHLRIREHHFLQINLSNGVTLQNNHIYKLLISYVGNINETPLSRGMFRGSYKDNNGKRHWYAATHLQPTNSRQLFPCFDEPGFKSNFDIIVNRPLHFTETYSNMRIKTQEQVGDRQREVFYTTPRMSAYLVTIHISEEFVTIADNNNVNASYRIIARPNANGQGDYALEVGPPLTKWLADYFNIPYYEMAENMKNDQIASPDWASGATENWGLVSYRELRLLYEEGQTNAADKMAIGTITAHELAHKWFGNLITCRWWDNVWINEGFASYFENFAMDGVDPSLELAEKFVTGAIQGALATDSAASTRALKHTVNTPAQVTGHFSGISYTKGASFLLMLKHLLGEPTFKKALNYFLIDRSYEHAFPLDLYNSFEKAVQEDGVIVQNLNIKSFMQYWVEERGYPVLNVIVNMETGFMTLTQERFFISASSTPTDQVWPLPLTYTSAKNPDFNNLTPKSVMVDKTIQIRKDPGEEWVIFNLQQKDFYRVNYDSHTWNLIASTLKNNRSSIPRLNRAQIVDDVFALMRSGRMAFDLGFKVLDFLREETDYYPWTPAITGFNWIRNRFLHLPETLKEFDEILYKFLEAIISDLGYDVQIDEAVTRTLNRFYILSFACNIGHEGCIKNAIAKFNALRSNSIAVNPNLRRHVFCQGLLNGGYDDWKYLYQRWLNSNNQADQSAMLRSLGCSSNKQAVQEYLEMILSDDLRAQDSSNAFTFLFMGNRGNTRLALDFIKGKVDEISQKLVLPAWFGTVLSNLAGYSDEEGLKEMEQWLTTNQATLPSFQVGLNAVTSARSNMQWGTDRADEILKAARGSATIALPATMLLFITSLALLLDYIYSYTLTHVGVNIAEMLRQLLLMVTCITVQVVYGDTHHRLNTTISPSEYSIIITPYFDTEDNRAFTFDGEVTIKFTTNSNINKIKIHSLDLNFTASNIKLTDGANVISLNEANPLEFEKAYSFAHINLANDISAGVEYTLNIIYQGPIRTDLSGFYRTYYIQNGVKKWLGATQMQPVHARKVFPSFDEPEYKAVFILTIDRPSDYQPSLAHTKLVSAVLMPNGYIREIFYPTPRMSTYLVAFLVSEFEAGASITVEGNEFGVYTRPDATNQTEYAFDVGQRIVKAFGDYFGIDYYSMNSNLRLDHVALMDFSGGAMENWGLITYRESLLLYVPEESTPYYKYRVAQIVAHETTHMWFGNLVTCHWWSNTWLNEGFANYFQDYMTSLIEPEIGADDQLVIGSVYSAYNADDNSDSAAITNNNVNSPEDISGHFGTITYQKAGSVIRMIHNLIGEDAFRSGLSSYLSANQFQSGYPQLLYSALEAGVTNFSSLSNYEGFDLTSIMSSWIAQPGNPILNVNVNYEDSSIELSQKRFYINSSDSSDELYKIPITYTLESDFDFVNTKPAFIMDSKTYVLPMREIKENKTWPIFNVQETGLYRVNYDSITWGLISEHLKSNRGGEIHYLNRAKIVNDLFALLFADEVKFELLYDVLQFLENENEYAVWYAALRGLNKLRNYYTGSDTLDLIDEFSLELIEGVISRIGYEVKDTDDFKTLRNRMQLLEFACKLGHQGCIDSSLQWFRDFKSNDVWIQPSLRPVAYCVGLKHGNDEDFDFLWNRLVSTNVANEATIIADNLGCSPDENKLNNYLVSMLLENSPIRTQDLKVPLTSVLSNYNNLQLVIQSLQSNVSLWNSIYPSLGSVLSSIASSLHTEDDFQNFESWLSSCAECDEAAVTSARNSVVKARAVTAWADSHKSDILASLKNDAILT